MISGVSNIIVPADDQERAKEFWSETIGFEVVVDAPYREERWIEVGSPDGVRLVLSKREEWSRDDRAVPDEVPTSNVMFHCDDPQATFEELSARGVQFPQPPIHMPFGWWSIRSPASSLYGSPQPGRPSRRSAAWSPAASPLEEIPAEAAWRGSGRRGDEDRADHARRERPLNHWRRAQGQDVLEGSERPAALHLEFPTEPAISSWNASRPRRAPFREGRPSPLGPSLTPPALILARTEPAGVEEWAPEGAQSALATVSKHADEPEEEESHGRSQSRNARGMARGTR
jgi:catechol 2,3-dioxygenase-like lactoylglutathione lyase family enzyme